MSEDQNNANDLSAISWNSPGPNPDPNDPNAPAPTLSPETSGPTAAERRVVDQHPPSAPHPDPVREFDTRLAGLERMIAQLMISHRPHMHPLPPPPPAPATAPVPIVPARPTSTLTAYGIPIVKTEQQATARQYGLHESSANRNNGAYDHGVDFSLRRPSSPNGRKKSSYKPAQPAKYDGSMSRTGHSKLQSFIAEVNRYVRALGYDDDSIESYDIGALLLCDIASQWLTQIENSTNPAVVKPTCWAELREMLKKRFVAPDITQTAYTKWQLVRYRGSINNYVHDFMQHLSLLPEFDDPHMQRAVLMQFLAGLEGTDETRFISFTLRDGMQSGRIVNIQDAIDVAVNAEANAGGSLASLTKSLVSSSSSSRRAIQSSSFNRSHSSSNNWRRQDSGSSNYRTASAHSYRTPIKPRVHQMVSDGRHSIDDSFDDRYYDNSGERNGDGDADEDADANADERVSTFDDGGTSRDDHSDDLDDQFSGLDSDAVLNVMRFTKKFGDVYHLSADELDRRRRHNLCFNCGAVGHRARGCKKPKSDGSGASVYGGTGGGGGKSLSNTNHRKN